MIDLIKFFDYKLSKKLSPILCVVSGFLFYISALIMHEKDSLGMSQIVAQKEVFIISGVIIAVVNLVLYTFKNFERFIDFFAYNFIIYIAMIIRLIMFNHMSNDYEAFLAPWVNFFRHNGGFKAIREQLGDYNVIYLYFLAIFSYVKNIPDLYLIKFFSIVFDFALGVGSLMLFREVFNKKNRELFVFGVILLLPTVFLNSSMWAQCDSVYVALAVFGIYYALKNKPKTSLVFFTISLAFKLQVVFVLPILVIFFIDEKYKLKDLIIIPVTYFISLIPALSAGKPLKDCLSIYLNQTKTYENDLTLNAASVYNFIPNVENFTSNLANAGILLTLGLLVLIFHYTFIKRSFITKELIFLLALLFVNLTPWILPHMHDRYFYFADTLTVVFALGVPRKFYVALLAQISSMIVYINYLLEFRISERFATLFTFGVIIIIGFEILKCFSNEENVVQNIENQTNVYEENKSDDDEDSDDFILAR